MYFVGSIDYDNPTRAAKAYNMSKAKLEEIRSMSKDRYDFENRLIEYKNSLCYIFDGIKFLKVEDLVNYIHTSYGNVSITKKIVYDITKKYGKSNLDRHLHEKIREKTVKFYIEGKAIIYKNDLVKLLNLSSGKVDELLETYGWDEGFWSKLYDTRKSNGTSINSTEIVIFGVKYKSIPEASRDLEVPRGTLYTYYYNSDGDSKYIEEKILTYRKSKEMKNIIDLKKSVEGYGCKIKVLGVVYKDLKEASKLVGLSESSLKSYAEKSGYNQEIFDKMVNNRLNKVRLVYKLKGKEFSSKEEFCKYYSIPKKVIKCDMGYGVDFTNKEFDNMLFEECYNLYTRFFSLSNHKSVLYKRANIEKLVYEYEYKGMHYYSVLFKGNKYDEILSNSDILEKAGINISRLCEDLGCGEV